MASDLQILKYMILGRNCVGKSALLTRYCENKFADNYEESKGVDFKSKVFDNQNLKIVIFDTPGYESYKFASYGFYKFASGFVLLFDLRNPLTLEALEQEIERIQTTAPKGAQMILVGNMSDLEQERRVMQQEATDFARIHDMPYMEISCLTGQNVDLVFENLTQRVQQEISSGRLILPKQTQQQENNKNQPPERSEGGCCCNIF